MGVYCCRVTAIVFYMKFINCLVLARGVSSHAKSSPENFSVLRGSTVIIPCKYLEENGENPVESVDESVHWTTGDNTQVSDSRFRKVKNGGLQIADAHVSDCGAYICHILPAGSSDFLKGKTYKHKLTVYEAIGHKFKTHVTLHMKDYSSETVTETLNKLLEKSVCSQNDLCESEGVKLENCKFSDSNEKLCEFSVSYAAVARYADPGCNEECLKYTMTDKLKGAEMRLNTELRSLAERNEEVPDIKANMVSFETHHMITCHPGFHLVQNHSKRCYPCHPGTYSGPNSRKCHLCDLGKYQPHYGKHTCEECPEGKTTENLGSTSKSKCIDADSGIMSDIKKGILSIFS